MQVRTSSPEGFQRRKNHHRLKMAKRITIKDEKELKKFSENLEYLKLVRIMKEKKTQRIYIA